MEVIFGRLHPSIQKNAGSVIQRPQSTSNSHHRIVSSFDIKQSAIIPTQKEETSTMTGEGQEEEKGRETDAPSKEEAEPAKNPEDSSSSSKGAAVDGAEDAVLDAVLDAVATKSIEEHARIDDPIEPPARNAPKTGTAGVAAQQELDDDPGITFLPANTKSILARLFDPDRKQKPQLWEHIKLVAPGPADQPPAGHIKWRSKDAVSAYCLKCRKQFTYTKGTSKTVSRHMQAYHGLVLGNEKDAPASPATNKRSGSGVTNAPPLKKRKPEVEQSAQVLLLKWMVSSFQPWSVVESPGMQDFVRCLSSDSFEMPTTEEIIPIAMENVEKVKVEVRRLLKDCDIYSISCVPFTHQGKQYTSATVTFCTPSFERKSLALGVMAGECNKETLTLSLSEFALSPAKVAYVTVKGGPDSLNLGLGQGGNSCVLSQMDSMVEEACASNAVIDTVVSHVLAKAGSKPSSFVQRVYTRLQAFGENSDLSEGQKMAILALQNIFQPFYDAHTTLSEEAYPTVGLAIPVFRRVRDVVTKLDVAELTSNSNDKMAVSRVKSFYNNLMKVFSTSFASLLGDDPPFMWTIPLDPRLIHMGGLSEAEQESVIKTLTEKVKEKKLEGAGTTGSRTSNSNNVSQSPSKSQASSTMGGIFWGDDLSADRDKTGGQDQAAAAYAKASVDRYCTAVKSQRRIDDPLMWWNNNQADFPEIAAMARVWLGASAVGPPLDQRSQFPEGHIELMAFLHDNATLIAGV